MAGPGRTASGVSTLGEDAQPSEEAGETLEWQGPLEWQSELDVAIAEIDSRLSHPRRRATDIQPALPNLGQPEITSEMIDEIAWRVSELLRGDGGAPAKATAVAAAISRSMTTAQAPPALRPPAPLPGGAGGTASGHCPDDPDSAAVLQVAMAVPSAPPSEHDHVQRLPRYVIRLKPDRYFESVGV